MKRRVMSLCLVSLLAGVYFLTFRGFPVSLDELELFSAAESLVKYHDMQLVSLYHEFPATYYSYAETPWQPAPHEPLQSVATVPLYCLAQHISAIGMLHTVWLFNIFVGIGIALSLYWGGVSLRYSDSASWMVALVVALGTMLWHYSQTFFREPLLGLVLLWVFLAALHVRQRYRYAPVLIPLILVGVLTKIAVLLALPALVLILIPGIQRHISGRVILAAVGALLLLGVMSLTLNQMIPNQRFDLIRYWNRAAGSDLGYVATVTGAYLVSPGRSIWATSPILLLALYGAWLSRENWRFATAPLLLLVVWALGYGLGGWDWHGGRGWGSRYLLPVVPVMGLLLLPVAQALTRGKIRRRWWIPLGLLMGFSLLIQFAGVFVSLNRYYEIIPAQFPDSPLDAFYHQGTWQVRYTQWYINLREFDLSNLDVAWSYTQSSWRGLLIGGLLIASSFMTYAVYRRKMPPRWISASAFFTFFLITIGFGWGLASLDRDSRLLADRPELHRLLAELDARAGDDDLIFLSDPDYRDFFLNFYKGDAQLVTLPYAPGERYSFEQVPLIQTDFPNERLGFATRYALDYAVKHHQTVWLVTNTSPFHAWAYRPVEQYLARHFYPVESVEDIAPDARLIRFDTTPAPAYDYRYHTLYITPRDPFTFGDHIRLSGYDFPGQVAAGEVLPISLRWESSGNVDFDYNVGVFLINADGALVASRNGQPQGTFGYTSRWEPGAPQGDNHGLLIPVDLPPGIYTLQVVMYDWRDAVRLPVFRDGNALDGDAAEIGTVEVISPD